MPELNDKSPIGLWRVRRRHRGPSEIHGGHKNTTSVMRVVNTGLQSQKAVTAYFSSEQILPFVFARQSRSLTVAYEHLCCELWHTVK